MEIWIFRIGGYSVLSDLDLGKKVGNLDFQDWGVFCTFGFGLRKKSWKFGFSGWGGTSVLFDLDLGKKVGNLDFQDGIGGYSGTSFEFGLRKKSWKFGFSGLGGILYFRIWT